MMSSQPSPGISIPSLIFPDFVREALIAEILQKNSTANLQAYNKNNDILLSEIEYVCNFVAALLHEDCIKKVKISGYEQAIDLGKNIVLIPKAKLDTLIGPYYDFGTNPNHYFHSQLIRTYIDMDLLAREIVGINNLAANQDKLFEANKILRFLDTLLIIVRSLKKAMPDKQSSDNVKINKNKQLIGKSHLDNFNYFIKMHNYPNNGIDPKLYQKFEEDVEKSTPLEAIFKVENYLNGIRTVQLTMRVVVNKEFNNILDAHEITQLPGFDYVETRDPNITSYANNNQYSGLINALRVAPEPVRNFQLIALGRQIKDIILNIDSQMILLEKSLLPTVVLSEADAELDNQGVKKTQAASRIPAAVTEKDESYQVKVIDKFLCTANNSHARLGIYVHTIFHMLHMFSRTAFRKVGIILTGNEIFNELMKLETAKLNTFILKAKDYDCLSSYTAKLTDQQIIDINHRLPAENKFIYSIATVKNDSSTDKKKKTKKDSAAQTTIIQPEIKELTPLEIYQAKFAEVKQLSAKVKAEKADLKPLYEKFGQNDLNIYFSAQHKLNIVAITEIIKTEISMPCLKIKTSQAAVELTDNYDLGSLRTELIAVSTAIKTVKQRLNSAIQIQVKMLDIDSELLIIDGQAKKLGKHEGLKNSKSLNDSVAQLILDIETLLINKITIEKQAIADSNYSSTVMTDVAIRYNKMKDVILTIQARIKTLQRKIEAVPLKYQVVAASSSGNKGGSTKQLRNNPQKPDKSIPKSTPAPLKPIGKITSPESKQETPPVFDEHHVMNIISCVKPLLDLIEIEVPRENKYIVNYALLYNFLNMFKALDDFQKLRSKKGIEIVSTKVKFLKKLLVYLSHYPEGGRVGLESFYSAIKPMLEVLQFSDEPRDIIKTLHSEFNAFITAGPLNIQSSDIDMESLKSYIFEIEDIFCSLQADAQTYQYQALVMLAAVCVEINYLEVNKDPALKRVLDYCALAYSSMTNCQPVLANIEDFAAELKKRVAEMNQEKKIATVAIGMDSASTKRLAVSVASEVFGPSLLKNCFSELATGKISAIGFFGAEKDQLIDNVNSCAIESMSFFALS